MSGVQFLDRQNTNRSYLQTLSANIWNYLLFTKSLSIGLFLYSRTIFNYQIRNKINKIQKIAKIQKEKPVCNIAPTCLRCFNEPHGRNNMCKSNSNKCKRRRLPYILSTQNISIERKTLVCIKRFFLKKTEIRKTYYFYFSMSRARTMRPIEIRLYTKYASSYHTSLVK